MTQSEFQRFGTQRIFQTQDLKFYVAKKAHLKTGISYLGLFIPFIPQRQNLPAFKHH